MLGGFALKNGNYASQLRDMIVRVSAQLPERAPVTAVELRERQYAEAGKLFALHEQEIYDALNHLVHSEAKAVPAAQAID